MKSKYGEQKQPNPEIGASFLKKLFFLWFDSFAWMGYRTPLTTDNMWDIRPEDTSREMVPEFDKHWLESVEKGKRKARNKSKTIKDDPMNNSTNVCHYKTVTKRDNELIFFIILRGAFYPPCLKRSVDRFILLEF